MTPEDTSAKIRIERDYMEREHRARQDMREQIARQKEEIKRLEDNHCKDCCCAQSWAALGITEYTGRSIPEEITRLREQVIKNRDIATDLQYICDDQEKEIKRLEDALVEERARRICHQPREDKVGHWPRYENVVVDEARAQLRAEGVIG